LAFVVFRKKNAPRGDSYYMQVDQAGAQPYIEMGEVGPSVNEQHAAQHAAQPVAPFPPTDSSPESKSKALAERYNLRQPSALGGGEYVGA
jgi:hypothetical protein